MGASHAMDDGFDFTEADERVITDVHEIPRLPGLETIRALRVAPRAQLMCVSGGPIGRAFALSDQAVVLGRAGAADVQLELPDVSRRHARITWRDGGYLIEDLNSANGTFVNGEPVKRSIGLRFGDRVQLGATATLVLGAHDELAARAAELRKLEAMEEVVVGLARDFNDAFMVIVGGLGDLAERVPADDAEAREVFADLREAAQTAGRLAARLISLHGQGELAADLVDLDALVREALVRAALPPAIATVLDMVAGARVRGSRDALVELVLALIANARDAMPDGGALTIAVRTVDVGHEEALERQLPRAGDYLELAISDRGRGMDAATLARAFEPFFTTKARKAGAGLGLPLVHATARRHGGGVDAQSRPGEGTTIRVWLPTARV